MSRVEEIFSAISYEEIEALNEQLLAGASAERIAQILTEHGHPVSATTMKKWRRDLERLAE